MTVPIRIAMMMARGRFFCGSLISRGQLVGLLEAEVGEHDARGRDRREQGLDPVGHEAVPAVKLPPWNLNSSTMMARTGTATFHQVMPAVDLAEQAHGQEVDRGEDRHQDDGHREAEPGDVALPAVRGGVEQAVPVVRRVLHHREALDGRHRDGLDPGEEAERDAGHAAEREVREPRRAAGDRVHRAQLGVHQGQDDDRDAADDPGQEGGWPRGLRTANSAPNSQPEPMIEVSDAQVAPISPISRLRPTSVGLVVVATDSVAMLGTFFPVRIRGPYGRGVGLMVMIVKRPEKKSVGFISVTRVTIRSRRDTYCCLWRPPRAHDYRR